MWRTTTERLAAKMEIYEAPVLTRLGTVSGLTLADPPGKQGPSFDSSQFQSNFSCVADQTPGSDCSENPAGGGN